MASQDDAARALDVSEGLLSFIRSCPSAFHTVAQVRSRLEAAGFLALDEREAWRVEPGGSYYVVRNGSSVVAFRMGLDREDLRFLVTATHADSPTFRLKPCAELVGPGSYIRLDVEAYGGVIDRSWLDRPLSVAGRVLTNEDGCIRQRLVAIDKDLLVIPSLAIHLDREVNRQGAIDRRTDICPLVSCGGMLPGGFDEFVAAEAGVRPGQVVARDLVLWNRQDPCVWGVRGEFVSAPRLDDLQCVFASLGAFLHAGRNGATQVLACFDNEEVGSGTRQGALGTFLPDVLRRVCIAVGAGEDGHSRAVAGSFMVSCDNAQAVHPNHPELYDEANRVWLNQGVAIKESANQRYATDAVGHAVFESLCRTCGVPTQRFANRSDMPGGSTIGNLLVRQVGMRTVDVGLPQLAMHSSYETAGVLDTEYLSRALRAFYEARLRFEPDGSVRL